MTFLAPVSPAYRGRRQSAIRTTLATIPDPAELHSAILRTYSTATADERAQGRAWYSAAHDVALSLPSDRPLSPAQRCGILAALSPQLSWDANVEAAATLCLTDGASAAPAALGLSIDRALAIYRGGCPADILGGRKVRSFYRNLFSPATAGPVTVDRHAISIAYGFTLSDTQAKILERCGAYTTIAAAYRSAARATDHLPHELQAITWLAHRRALDDAGHGGARTNAFLSDLSTSF